MTTLQAKAFGYEIDINPLDQGCNANLPPTPTEIKLSEKNKQKIFKTTITVCVIYGIIALILLLIILFSDDMKRVLLTDFLPFITIFIIGAIFIILYLSNKVYNWKAEKICPDSGSDDFINCPDYWQLSYIPGNPDNYKYVCKMNKDIFNKENTFKYDPLAKITNSTNAINDDLSAASKTNLWDTNSNFKDDYHHLYRNLNNDKIKKNINLTNADYTNFKTNINNMVKSTPEITVANTSDTPIVCDQVFPQYLGNLDSLYASTDPENTNINRCAYANACGIPWSDANCS